MKKRQSFSIYLLFSIGVFLVFAVSCAKDDDNPVQPGGTVTDIDGNEYNTVVIGYQEWMAENLKTTTYKDGTSIDLVSNYATWGLNTTGAYCWYGNDEAQYAETYGAMYNWNAVNTGNLCPDGWHMPSDEEWKTLEMELGMSQAEADNISYFVGRGTNEGSKLAGNGSLWNYKSSLENNSGFGRSGFTALPGGIRLYEGRFDVIGFQGYWWTATEAGTESAWHRYLMNDLSGVGRSTASREVGLSVRCVRD